MKYKKEETMADKHKHKKEEQKEEKIDEVERPHPTPKKEE